jgi:fimbrial chaperone protein
MPKTACAINCYCKCRFLFLVVSGLLVGIVFFSPSLAFAGEWRVAPIRLFFERGSRSGIVNVQNDGDASMNFQVKAMEWTQDAEGKDQYSETNDLIFFPKFLMVPPKEERAIRIGNKGVSGVREKTFRLFVEEVSPPRRDEKTEGATVSVNVRFAVPLFISPVKEEPAGKLVKTDLRKGIISATLQNTGNVHFRLNSLDIRGRNVKGEETFTQKVDGWYLLNGTTRTFSAQIPAESCMKTEMIEVEGSADRKIVLKASLAVDKNQCKP